MNIKTHYLSIGFTLFLLVLVIFSQYIYYNKVQTCICDNAVFTTSNDISLLKTCKNVCMNENISSNHLNLNVECENLNTNTVLCKGDV